MMWPIEKGCDNIVGMVAAPGQSGRGEGATWRCPCRVKRPVNW